MIIDPIIFFKRTKTKANFNIKLKINFLFDLLFQNDSYILLWEKMPRIEFILVKIFIIQQLNCC